jgi:MoaA/NifB/PqqE/SkfB family radical SAM enzyme
MDSGTFVNNLKYILSYYTNIPIARPEFATIALTIRCNSRCLICTHWKEPVERSRELQLDDFKNLIQQLDEFGVEKIDFSGGEPLVRKNVLLECIKFAHSRDMETYLTTNALTIGDRTAEQLVSSGIRYINISLDGASPETHDYLRGVPGSFSRALSAIDLLKKHIKKHNAEAEISLATVITNTNLEELKDIHKLTLEYDLCGVTYNPYVLDNVYWRRKDYDSDEFWVPQERISILKSVIAELIQLKREHGKIHNSTEVLELVPLYFEKKRMFKSGRCLAGYRNIYIDPYGAVQVCGKGPGLSINNRSINDIWNSLPYWVTRMKIRACTQPCLYTCYYRLSIKKILASLRRARG